MSNKEPKVGIGIALVKGGKVLLGKRIKTHQEGSWCIPGGHLEYMESFEDAARRELKEETGMSVGTLRTGSVGNDMMPNEDKHYISIIMVGEFSAESQ